MQLTVKTSVLQDMVAKAMKGAPENKLIPITSLLHISLRDGELTLTTSDATNYLYIKTKLAGEKFEAVVQTDIFSKLIAKLTCEEVTLTKEDGKLTVSGNGNYTIELPLDESGKEIKYPNPIGGTLDVTEEADVKLSIIKLVLATAKSSLSTDINQNCYTGYYMADNVVATDTFQVCGVDTKVFKNPVLVSSAMLDLFEVFTEENIKMKTDGQKIVFESENCAIYGRLMDCIDDFQIEPISKLLGQDFKSCCVVSKAAMLQLLDRLSLFVGKYDKNEVYLTFTKDGIQLNSKKSDSIELVKYINSENFEDYTCCINIEMLLSQIKTTVADKIEVYYGLDNAIKIVDGNITKVIALCKDDREA